MSGNLTIAEDDNNDMYLDNTGNIAMFNGVQALEVQCKAALEAQLNEMVLQTNQGMPTLQAVFQNMNLQQYVAAGRARLTAITGVVQVSSFTISISGNKLFYTADILTIYSPTLVTVTNGTLA